MEILVNISTIVPRRYGAPPGCPQHPPRGMVPWQICSADCERCVMLSMLPLFTHVALDFAATRFPACPKCHESSMVRSTTATARFVVILEPECPGVGAASADTQLRQSGPTQISNMWAASRSTCGRSKSRLCQILIRCTGSPGRGIILLRHTAARIHEFIQKYSILGVL